MSKRNDSMASTSSINSTPSGSPAMSPRSQPMQISSAADMTSHQTTTHVLDFPSSSLRRHSFKLPSAYISDEDLFGDDTLGYLSEPPPPPRPAEAFLARPLLPPCVETRRRSSGHEQKLKKTTKVRSFNGPG